MQECRLAAHDLACRRGDRVLFNNLSLDLKPGDALHIAGPNGVGKSSLIRILAGLALPFAGAVAREGTVALLDDRPALDPHLPLRKALNHWARIDGGTADPVRFGLSRLLDVPVRYLSTGQKKRAGIARMVGQAAPIWMLDEPLNGLDTEAIGMVEAMASSHCAQGGICIIASHQTFRFKAIQTLNLADYAI
jgi:heme exporter protein A